MSGRDLGLRGLVSDLNNSLSPNASPAEVAVIIAAFRAADRIGRAVASALEQPETREVIVIDDASADDGATLEAARRADDGTNRLTIIALKDNKGPAHARNRGIAASRSPWISILDSDDFMERHRFQKMFGLAEGPFDIIADDLYQVNENDEQGVRRTMRLPETHPSQNLTLETFLAGNLPDPARPRTELGFLKPVMKRDFLDRHALRYDEQMRLGEDYQLYAEALISGARFQLVQASGYVAVMRRGSLSDRHNREDLLACEDGDRRLLSYSNISASARRLMIRRLHSTQCKIAWIDFMDAIKSRRLPRAAWIVLGRPRCAFHIMTGLFQIAARRFGRAASHHGEEVAHA